jgi:lipid II:glycine glycyltransferase (peptidoglycan interpeptide bridge formation enzyme)
MQRTYLEIHLFSHITSKTERKTMSDHFTSYYESATSIYEQPSTKKFTYYKCL